MYNDDDVYQYIAHLVLLFYVVMMELSFVIIYSTMGLLIYKYEPYWKDVIVEYLILKWLKARWPHNW